MIPRSEYRRSNASIIMTKDEFDREAFAAKALHFASECVSVSEYV